MNNEEQQINSQEEMQREVACVVVQAHKDGKRAVTPKQLLDERVRAGAGINAAEYIAAIKGIGKSMEYRGLLTNTGTDDDPAWAPTSRLLESPSVLYSKCAGKSGPCWPGSGRRFWSR